MFTPETTHKITSTASYTVTIAPVRVKSTVKYHYFNKHWHYCITTGTVPNTTHYWTQQSNADMY